MYVSGRPRKGISARDEDPGDHRHRRSETVFNLKTFPATPTRYIYLQ